MWTRLERCPAHECTRVLAVEGVRRLRLLMSYSELGISVHCVKPVIPCFRAYESTASSLSNREALVTWLPESRNDIMGSQTHRRKRGVCSIWPSYSRNRMRSTLESRERVPKLRLAEESFSPVVPGRKSALRNSSLPQLLLSEGKR